MDCRKSLLLASLLSMAAGCTSLNPFAAKPAAPAEPLPSAAAMAQAAVKKKMTPEIPPPDAVITKDKEGPKRPPKASTVNALAVMREREAAKTEDASHQMKLYDDARQLYQQALKIEANNREAQYGLARIYAKMNNYERSTEIYDQMLQKDPKDHGTWFELGNCLNRKKDFEAASQCFVKALELDPENRLYLQTLGFTLARAGSPDDAANVLTKVMGACHAHYNVGRMLHHLGQKDAARQHLQRAIQADGKFEPAKHMLAAIDNPPTPVTPIVHRPAAAPTAPAMAPMPATLPDLATPAPATRPALSLEFE